ncbi:MAG: carboxypeptidase regulatory-like domain-containing protein [Acidobacteria bacterium]|nr:carboxypeptidase regulatory-like domain-containing protein [Acidobacteriota bacterium]
MSARIHGVVTDSDGEPVPDATIVVEFQGGVARKFELTTNDEGEFIQMGLQRGPYSVSVVKEGVGALNGTVTLRAGESFEMNMELLSPGEVIRESLSEAQLAELEAAEATTDAFNRGLAAARSGNLDEAATLLTSALDAVPACAECQRNLGIVYTQMAEYAQAETAFKAALALQPDNAASYVGLAEIYNAQRRFADAAEASAAAVRLSGAAAGGGGFLFSSLIRGGVRGVRGTRDLLARVRKLPAKRAEVRAHPHAFRRTLATELVRAGVSLPAVQKILGHAQLTMTADYVDVRQGEMRVGLEVFARDRPECQAGGDGRLAATGLAGEQCRLFPGVQLLAG